jgi:hypothetical protein
MTRLYGRAAKPQRVIEAVPDTRFHRTTILSSIRQDGTTISFVFERALNRDLFRAYITQWQAPSLKPGDLGVMDNLSSHKVSGGTIKSGGKRRSAGACFPSPARRGRVARQGRERVSFPSAHRAGHFSAL